MERPVKERLIGAAVLVAAAVILIPEMLSGPQHAERGQEISPGHHATEGHSEPPLKTYTIDLSKPPSQAAPAGELAEEVDSSSPAADQSDQPEEVIVASKADTTVQGTPDRPATEVRDQDGSAQNDSTPDKLAASQPEPSKPAESKPAEPRQTQSPPPVAVAKHSTAPTPAPNKPGQDKPSQAKSSTDKTSAPQSSQSKPVKIGWAVQLGSFASRSTAQGMVDDLRSKGYDAFVMPVKSGSTTLYRVRLGPVGERQEALELLRKVKPIAPVGAVVPHP